MSKDENCYKDYIAVAEVEEKIVTTLEEYLYEVDKIFEKIMKIHEDKGVPNYSPKLWFRGLKRADFNLEPTINRNKTILGETVKLNTDYETLYLSKFKSSAVPYVLDKSPAFPYSQEGSSYWEWLFLMQDYGLPTRLLDWSKDALVALLFATSDRNSFEQGDNAAVWCLDPIKLNAKFNFYSYYQRGYIPNVSEEVVNEFFGPEANLVNKRPAAVFGPKDSPRIIAQKGVFTVFPKIKDMVPLNLLPKSSNYLYKITLDKSFIEKLPSQKDKITFTDQLRRYGYTYQDLFPEIDKIDKKISEEGF